MIDHIYLEEKLRGHPRAERILRRFPSARVITIEHYGEIFNRRNQNFRLQKRNPALILADKRGRRVLEAPAAYGIGDERNFYFSHVLNCLYDCRYCFLQGMYRSAHYVLFVNFEDFQRDIERTARHKPGGTTSFFSGYDGDSLALEAISGFVEEFVPFFARHPESQFELRTKSIAIRPLMRFEPTSNCIVAFSFTPPQTNVSLEHGVSDNDARIQAALRLAERGWPIGLRFDPLMFTSDFEQRYDALFGSIFTALDPDSIHSVSWGPFRLPKDFYKRMSELYPEEPAFASTSLTQTEKLVSYPGERESEMLSFCGERLRRYVPAERLFPITGQ